MLRKLLQGNGTTNILLLSVGIAVAVLFISQTDLRAASGPPFPLTGFAWASADDFNTAQDEGGVGWISFSCTDGGPGLTNVCGTSNYGVQIDTVPTVTTPALLSGFAWAGGNIDVNGVKTPFGYVKFGNNGCPAADVDGVNCQPHVVSDGKMPQGWEISGWARACSVFVSGCSGPTKSVGGTSLGGWDGWISLNCKNTDPTPGDPCPNQDYAIRISSTGVVANAQNQTGSFAWGGNIVMGWVDFGAISGLGGSGVTITDTCSVGSTFACNGNVLEETGTDLWCSAVNNTTDCSLTGQVCNATNKMCESLIAPQLNSFSISPQIVRSGGTVNVSWSIQVPASYSCTVAGAGINQGFTGPGSFTGSNVVTASITNQTNVVLNCSGTTYASGTVRVIPSVYES